MFTIGETIAGWWINALLCECLLCVFAMKWGVKNVVGFSVIEVWFCDAGVPSSGFLVCIMNELCLFCGSGDLSFIWSCEGGTAGGNWGGTIETRLFDRTFWPLRVCWLFEFVSFCNIPGVWIWDGGLIWRLVAVFYRHI